MIEIIINNEEKVRLSIALTTIIDFIVRNQIQ
jgi:hypothetical protein